MPKLGKVTKRARATDVIEGLLERFTDGRTYFVGGKEYTRGELVAAFQSLVDAIDEVDATRAAAADAVARERAVARRVAELTRQLKTTVSYELGITHEHFAAFGWPMPKTPGPKTVKAKLEGAAKGRETRKARGTMGKRQRRKMRG